MSGTPHKIRDTRRRSGVPSARVCTQYLLQPHTSAWGYGCTSALLVERGGGCDKVAAVAAVCPVRCGCGCVRRVVMRPTCRHLTERPPSPALLLPRVRCCQRAYWEGGGGLATWDGREGSKALPPRGGRRRTWARARVKGGAQRQSRSSCGGQRRRPKAACPPQTPRSRRHCLPPPPPAPCRGLLPPTRWSGFRYPAPPSPRVPGRFPPLPPLPQRWPPL